MSGLKPIKVYLYESNGDYIRNFPSISDFSRCFQLQENAFSNRKDTDYRPDVIEFEDGRIASTSRIGREGIREYKQYKRSEYTKYYRGRRIAESILKKNKKDQEIEVYNLDNELIATFKNVYFAKKLMNLSASKELNIINYNDQGLRFKRK